MAGQLLLVLSILVGVHELGHMLSAKYFGMRVEKYSIGFPPKIFSFKKGETEYSLGAVPLGGFVKISGMVDESLDTDKLKHEPEPWEFRSKPAWQRLIVMLGGIIVNVLVGILIFVGIFWIYGEKFYSAEDVNKNGIVAYELGEKIGFKTGDQIIDINGKPFERFPQDIVTPDILLSDSSYYSVKRGDETLKVYIPTGFISDLSKSKGSFVFPAMPFEVGKVIEGKPAEKAGLKEGDRILKVNGENVPYFQRLQEILADNKKKDIDLTVLRKGDEKKLTANVTDKGIIGFYPVYLMEERYAQYPIGQAIPAGFFASFEVVTSTFKAFGEMIKGRLDPSESVAGPLGIAKEFGGDWIWERFWRITGALSMVLAFMNLLPIPALDGGHVMFLSYEMIAGRKPSDKFLENAQKVGMVLLLTLMVLVFSNDIYKLVFK